MWRMVRLAGMCTAGIGVVLMVGGVIYQRVADTRDIASTPPPGRMVDVGGYRLHLWCAGAGPVPVILESGLGDTAFVWNVVRSQVAPFARVCAYDRAGIGYSDAGPTPRSGRRIVTELATMLERAGVDRPIVLVGASLGGLYARLFAAQYPGRIAGLVLVDSSHEDQRLDTPMIAPLVPLLGSVGAFRLAGVSLGRDPATEPDDVRTFQRAVAFRSVQYHAVHDEFLGIPETTVQVRSTRRTLTIPLTVVTSGRGDRDSTWHRLQVDLASTSTRGCRTVAAKSGHIVSRGQPEMVTAAIRATIDATGDDHTIPCELTVLRDKSTS